MDIDDNGKVYGVPSNAGITRFTVHATDSSTYQYGGEHDFSIVVEPVVTITTSSPLPTGFVGEPYIARFSAHGGSSHTYQIFGQSPPGLSVNAETGVLSGTPTQEGEHSFVLGVAECSAQFGNGTNGREKFGITIKSNLGVHFNGLTKGQVGQPYTGSIIATGGSGKYKYEVGGLPKNGVSWNQADLISGTPTISGPINFTVAINDGHSHTPQIQCQINVVPATTNAGALAIADLYGEFFAGDSAHIDIKGVLSGGGLDEKSLPSELVTLSIKRPGQTDFVPQNKSAVKWHSTWDVGGWHFTITGIPWPSGDELPKFDILASVGERSSRFATTLFPLRAFIPVAEFQDDTGTIAEDLSFNAKTTSLRLHLVCRHALDSLSVYIQLPDGIEAAALTSIQAPFEIKSDWNGRLRTLFFTLKAGSNLTVPANKKSQSFDIQVPIKISGSFPSGTVHAYVQSDSMLVSLSGFNKIDIPPLKLSKG